MCKTVFRSDRNVNRIQQQNCNETNGDGGWWWRRKELMSAVKMKMSSAQRREEKGKLAHADDVLRWEKIENSCTAISVCNNVASGLNYWLQQICISMQVESCRARRRMMNCVEKLKSRSEIESRMRCNEARTIIHSPASFTAFVVPATQ